MPKQKSTIRIADVSAEFANVEVALGSAVKLLNSIVQEEEVMVPPCIAAGVRVISTATAESRGGVANGISTCAPIIIPISSKAIGSGCDITLKTIPDRAVLVRDFCVTMETVHDLVQNMQKVIKGSPQNKELKRKRK